MKQLGYRICTNCIMDTTDPEITFDEKGICNHCRNYKNVIQKYLFTPEEKSQKLNEVIESIKLEGKDKSYDCIIGVSGGVDSTYVAYMVKKLGLRPLAIHLDNGWNSELAVSNIEKMLKKLEIDLYTYVINWEEFKDLQLSFLKASTPDGEIPTDHAIRSILSQMAAKEGVNYIITGYNLTSESILPRRWAMGHDDWKYIKSVHNQFGKVKLKTYPHMEYLGIYYRFIKKQKSINLLDYIEYKKKDAMEVIEKELGWKYYGGKHYESIYTRFFQGYILPEKFNIDKRKAHLSSLICSGELSREEALEEIKKETYPDAILKEDKEFVIKKFDINDEDFIRIMKLPIKSFWDYPSYINSPFFTFTKRIYKLISAS